VENDETIAAPEHKKACFFSLRGAVNGIPEELALSNNIPSLKNKDDDDDDSWILRRIIMSRLQASPTLYEMIQTTAYCLMYEAKEADLVRVLQRQQQRWPKTRKKKKKEADEDHENTAANKLTDYFENKESENGTKNASSQSEKTKLETDHKQALIPGK
jgi:hypothetical protein